MEPYRQAGFRCPTCRTAPLRAFHDRLCCDECTGIFLTEHDFASACGDLAGQETRLQFRGEQATVRMCPRCNQPLVAADVVLDPSGVTAHVLRCTRDGLWCPRGVVAGVFARMGRVFGGRGGGMSNALQVLNRKGNDGLAIPSHGPATAGLAISQWRSRPRQRAKTMSTVNAFRDQQLLCPACAPPSELVFMGDRYGCGECGGVFVENAALEAMIFDMSGTLFELPPLTGIPSERYCPMCRAVLVTEELQLVAIDRCAQHGVWFDPSELALALEHASGQHEARGLRGWLKKLFA
jgi:Zn-finger nucleic acid-binding protein